MVYYPKGDDTMQLALDGRNALDISIDIMREFEPPEGYWLAFSGGKDSVALKRVADIAGVKYDAHYSMTTVDPPEVTRFIRRQFPDVEWIVPEEPLWKLVETKGLPTRGRRWCCSKFKEVGGKDRHVLLGLRADESAARAKRGVFKACHKTRKWFISPLMHWTESDVWAFHESERLPRCSLYDEGWDRIGCVICPFARKKDYAIAMERWPVYFRLVRSALDVYFSSSEACQERWSNPEEMWQWWIAQDVKYPKPFEDRPPTLSFEE